MYDIIETELSQMSKGLSIMGGFVVIYGLISFFVKEPCTSRSRCWL